MNTSQIKQLVEHHLLQLEAGSGCCDATSLYSIVKNVDAHFNHVQLPRAAVLHMKKKWLVLPLKGEIYLLDCTHWLFVTGDDDEFLTIELKDLLCIHIEQQKKSGLSSSSDCIIRGDDDDIEAVAVETTPVPCIVTKYRPLNMSTFIDGLKMVTTTERENRSSNHSLERQLQWWCDYALVNVHFENNVAEKELLYKKLLKNYDSHCLFNNKGDVLDHWYSSFALLYSLMDNHIEKTADTTTFQDTLLKYELVHDIDFPMLQEFIEWELFLYKHCKSDLSDEYLLCQLTNVMNAHLKWYYTECDEYGIPRPLWFDYHLLEDNPRIFWLIKDDHGGGGEKLGFWVRFEWVAHLLSPQQRQEENDFVSTYKVVQGRVLLCEADFLSLFMPNLYKQILLDTMRFLYMMRSKQCGDSSSSASLMDTHFSSRRGVLTHFYENLPPFKLKKERGYKHYHHLLYEYSLLYGVQHGPVIKRIIRLEEELSIANPTPLLQPHKTNTFATQLPFKQVVTRVPDIEDLVQHLPPCLKNMVGVKHLNNDDRRTVIPYFIDMNYNKASTVHKLSLEKEDVPDLDSQYKWQVFRNANPKPGEPKRDNCSLYCGSIINLKPGTEHTIACPYEVEKRKGGASAPRPANYSDVERREMRFKCANTLRKQNNNNQQFYINHPIDYVHNKLNMSSK